MQDLERRRFCSANGADAGRFMMASFEADNTAQMHPTFGLATKARAVPGHYPQLVEALKEVSRLAFNIPGCVGYVVSSLPAEPETVFITEFWDSQASQQSAFAMAGIYEVMVRFQALACDVEQHELCPLQD